MRCVGYRQAWEYLDGAHRRARRCATRGIAATRQLAKRQLTWLRATPADAFDPQRPDALAARARGAIAAGRSAPDGAIAPQCTNLR